MRQRPASAGPAHVAPQGVVTDVEVLLVDNALSDGSIAYFDDPGHLFRRKAATCGGTVTQVSMAFQNFRIRGSS
jgi:hypothetical protein